MRVRRGDLHAEFSVAGELAELDTADLNRGEYRDRPDHGQRFNISYHVLCSRTGTATG